MEIRTIIIWDKKNYVAEAFVVMHIYALVKRSSKKSYEELVIKKSLVNVLF